MYAVIETGGKQVKVELGQEIYVEKLDSEEQQNVRFDKVLSIVGKKTLIGTPYVSGAYVEGKVLKQGRKKKIIVFKYGFILTTMKFQMSSLGLLERRAKPEC